MTIRAKNVTSKSLHFGGVLLEPGEAKETRLSKADAQKHRFVKAGKIEVDPVEADKPKRGRPRKQEAEPSSEPESKPESGEGSEG